MIDTNRGGTIAAITALAAAALLFAAALARALTLDPVIPSEPPVAAAAQPAADEGPPAAPRVPSEATLSTGDIALAVDHDPFQPDRSRPAPYRLPGEDLPVIASGPDLPPAPEFTMTGVVQMGDGGLALIQLPDQTPQVLGIGESLLGYRLERVGATSATLVGSGRTLELEIAAAAPQAGTDSRNSRTSQATADAVRAALQGRMGGALNTILGQAQRSGASAEQLQALIEQMGGRGGARGRVTIRRDTTDVPSRTPND
jgi:hypothetical protein